MGSGGLCMRGPAVAMPNEQMAATRVTEAKADWGSDIWMRLGTIRGRSPISTEGCQSRRDSTQGLNISEVTRGVRATAAGSR